MNTPALDEAQTLRKERLYVIILAAIQVVHILDFVIMMPLGPRFMRVFGITPIEFSTLVSAYTFSAGIVGFFGALYADHFDRKKFLMFNFTGFIIGTFMCAIAPNFAALVGMTEEQLPLIYLIGGIGTIISARIIGKLCDKIGSYKVLRVVAVIAIFPMLLLTSLPPTAMWVALIVTSLFTMFGSGRFIPAMTLVSAVVKPEERGTFMSLENAARQLSSGLASQAAGLIIGSTAAGALTHYNVVGYIGAATSVIAIYIAFKIKTKFNLR